MEKLIQSYLDNSSFVERGAKVKLISQDYKITNSVVFTYSHDGSKHDKKMILDIWDLLIHTFIIAM